MIPWEPCPTVPLHPVARADASDVDDEVAPLRMKSSDFQTLLKKLAAQDCDTEQNVDAPQKKKVQKIII